MEYQNCSGSGGQDDEAPHPSIQALPVTFSTDHLFNGPSTIMIRAARVGHNLVNFQIILTDYPWIALQVASYNLVSQVASTPGKMGFDETSLLGQWS